MFNEQKMRERSDTRTWWAKVASKKGIATILVIMLCCVSFAALASCQPAASDGEKQADAQAEGTGSDSIIGLDSGEWADTQYSQAVNAGNRGCNSCHADLFTVLPSGANSKGLHEVDKPPAYGKVYSWNDCTTCHVHSPGTGSALGGCGPYMAPSIHGYHYANQEFEQQGGTCFSCHEVDITTGALGMWDELKYTQMIGLANGAKYEKFETWIGGRGYATSTVTGGMIERNITFDDTNLSQDISGPEDLYSATNLDYPDLNEDNYTLTVSGVVNEKTYTLEELRALPQNEVTYTKVCMTNGKNGGWYIANIPVRGVLVSDLIADCGGLLESSIAYSYEGHDGWFGGSTPNLNEFPMSYMDPNAMVALEFWDKPIEYIDGGPAFFIQPGSPANTTAKWVKELIFHEGVNLDPEKTLTKYPFPAIWAGWFNPVRDGQEVKVGETITLEGYAWAMPEQGKNRTTSVEISADYGETWTSIAVPEDFDRDQWVLWSADWTPQVAGTYCLTVKCGSELAENPTNSGSVLITVVE